MLKLIKRFRRNRQIAKSLFLKVCSQLPWRLQLIDGVEDTFFEHFVQTKKEVLSLDIFKIGGFGGTTEEQIVKYLEMVNKKKLKMFFK